MILAKCSIRLNCLMSLIFYMTSFSRHTLNGSFSWVITRSLLREEAPYSCATYSSSLNTRKIDAFAILMWDPDSRPFIYVRDIL